MYLARYEDDRANWLQAAVYWPWIVREQHENPHGWCAVYRQAIGQVVAAPGVDFAFRLSLRGRCLERLLLLHAPDEKAAQLENLVGAFARLEGILAGSVQFCISREWHDNIVQNLPSQCARLCPDVLSVGVGSVAADFHLAPQTGALVSLALGAQVPLLLQWNARRSHDAEALRVVRKNLARLENEASLPRSLINIQARLAQKLAGAVVIADEFIAVDPHLWGLVLDLLHDRFRAEMSGVGFRDLPLEGGSWRDFQEALCTGFHASLFDEVAPLAQAASAFSGAEISQIMLWNPPPAWDSGWLDNVRVTGASELDYLRRIEVQLARLEQQMQARSIRAVECDEMKRAIGISRADPQFAAVKARQILETIVTRIYGREMPGQRLKPLFNMIDDLENAPRSIFPGKIKSYLHTVRVLGNAVVHPGATPTTGRTNPLSATDVELSLLMILEIIEWYLLDYSVTGAS